MGSNAALAALLGVGAGLGLILILTALRHPPAPAGDPRWRDSLARLRALATWLRVTSTLLAAALVARVTRWPVGSVLAGLAAWFLPRILGRDRGHETSLARIEAMASWTEQLRDTLAAAAGLEQAILATAPIAPEPVREEVAGLAAAIHRGERLPAGLRAFAEQAADPGEPGRSVPSRPRPGGPGHIRFGRSAALAAAVRDDSAAVTASLRPLQGPCW
ncbi:MAG TPA: hypothetical protein VGI74_12900 [Streptosporangiaceae bacterium]|jgi:hypothetical protein